MTNINVYMKCERNIEVQGQDVYMSDIGSLRCQDKILEAKLKSIKVYRFLAEGPRRCVIDCTRLIRLMEEVCPDITVSLLGEPDILVEQVTVPEKKGPKQRILVLFVCMVSFFGTAYTIMAYHNDVGINGVFEQVYHIFMGTKPTDINPLEVSYSIGLSLGIIIFFNHIGGRRLTKDPTPIEVSIRNYEEDVDKTLIALADREGKEEE